MISETKRKATWQELADRVDELQEKLDNSISKDKLVEAIDFAINATDSTDDYSIGLCNGMIYVKALLTDGNPDYKKCQNNNISKDKIKEKIIELEKSELMGRYYYEQIKIATDILKELLDDTNNLEIANIKYSTAESQRNTMQELLKGE